LRRLSDIQVLINFLYCEIYILITYCGEIRLNEIELEELVKIIDTKLNKSPPNYDLFLTEQGKKFQIDMIDLMGIISIGNLIPALPGIISSMMGFVKDSIQDEDLDFDVVFIPRKPGSIIKKQKMKMEDVIDDFTKSITISDKVTTMINGAINRLNSYYFLALFAYMDHYVSSLYLEFLGKYCTNHSIEMIDSWRTKGKPKLIIEKFRTHLDLGEIKKRIITIPDRKPWHDSFMNMLKLRHEFAHKVPSARREILEEKLKRISSDATKEVRKLFRNEFTVQNMNNEQVSEIQNILKPNFEILVILNQVGKECLGYLALYDHLLDEYFTKNKPI